MRTVLAILSTVAYNSNFFFTNACRAPSALSVTLAVVSTIAGQQLSVTRPDEAVAAILGALNRLWCSDTNRHPGTNSLLFGAMIRY